MKMYRVLKLLTSYDFITSLLLSFISQNDFFSYIVPYTFLDLSAALILLIIIKSFEDDSDLLPHCHISSSLFLIDLKWPQIAILNYHWFY